MGSMSSGHQKPGTVILGSIQETPINWYVLRTSLGTGEK
jgi:hypothetical protein